MNVQAAINAGLFVEFVYSNWNKVSQTTNLTGQDVVTNSNTPVIPGKRYVVTNTIYSNDLATDICPSRPILEGFKTIGIVAANSADPTDVFIAIRGTSNIWEWVQDFKFLPRPFNNVPGSGLTEDGFTDMYLSFSLTPGPSLTFMADLKAAMPSNAMVTIAGHSLGSALATLLALDMAVNTTTTVGIYTLASPRVGDLQFMHLFNHVVSNAYRVANRLDIVPKTPPPLLYFHVGDETDLIPGNIRFDLACEHNILNYLSMLADLIDPNQTQYPIVPSCQKSPAPAGSGETEV